ncbi:MAG: heat-inducible transcription repressor HrcA [Gammaproteobacteria bacterium]|nr:MAG: heat-inducible transcription repressor HrcA [Gammaproteobacteria bacterium]
MNEHHLDERARKLLKTLIESYIEEGRPVGSRTLAKRSGLGISPATVRNVMMDLEEKGLVTSPHTSAGRIPTAGGYRLFVDSLMTPKPLPSYKVRWLKAQLTPDQTMESLLEAASGLLSGITHLAGVVMWPKKAFLSLRRVEFLSLPGNRVLAIMVLNEREVQSSIIETDRHYTARELEEATSYLNRMYSGLNLFSIREGLLKEMKDAREDMGRIMHAAVNMAEKVFNPEKDKDDYVLAGEANLLDFVQQSNVDRLRGLFKAFNHKRDILHLLDRCMHSEDVDILIGEESGYHVLEGYSVITSPYKASGQALGVVGVIGPTRMPYERIVPIVHTTAKLLGDALSPQSSC